MDLATILKLEITATASTAVGTVLADTNPRAVLIARFIDSLVDGTGLDSANQVYTISGGIGAGLIVDVDLDGVVADVFGATVTMLNVKAFFVKNTSTTDAVILVGGGSNGLGLNAFDTWITQTVADGSEQVRLPKNAAMMIWNPTVAGYVSTTGQHLLSLEEETTTDVAAYEVMVIGEV